MFGQQYVLTWLIDTQSPLIVFDCISVTQVAATGLYEIALSLQHKSV